MVGGKAPDGRRLPVTPSRPRGQWRLALRAVLPALLLAAAACGDGDATGSGADLTREEFIEVIVALREAEREALDADSAAVVFARRREEILERHGTSEEELRAFIEAASRDIAGMSALWEEISRRLRRPVPADSL